MNDAVQMYEGVLYEIDSTRSAELDVADFNYHVNAAVEKFLVADLNNYDLTQTITDKIRPLVKKTAPLTLNADNSTNVKSIALPNDYRHLVSCLVRLRYKQATVSFAVGAKRLDYSRRLTGDMEAVILNNVYLEPLVSDADLRLFHRVIGNTLYIEFDTPVRQNNSVVVEDVTIEYISQAPRIELDVDDQTIVTDTVFPPNINQEIVKICAQSFLENSGNQRLGSFTQVNS